MPTTQPITLFHAPQTRSTGVLALLEELRAPYKLHALNMKAGEQRQSAYLSLNPMGKVPAILHGHTLITEQVAIGIYLADLFPEAGITPAIDDELRGPYLRWYVFYAACFEPALVDKAMKREPGPIGMMPYGDLATTLNAVTTQLSKGPWILGDRFTAADVLWGSALTSVVGFGLIDAVAPIKNYIDLWNARPSVSKVAQVDAELLKAQGNA
ncbi:MAG TPA: glutathione S-transferase family protein [Steroidobacteraceae bacterium]